MSLRRAHLYSLTLTGASFAVAAALYSRLPDPVPTHWDFAGNADGFTPKPWGAFMLPLIQLGVWALLAVVPLISPRRYSIAPFAGVYGKLVVAVNVFETAAGFVTLMAAAGMPIVSMPRFFSVAIGLLLVVVGNYLGKMTPNFWSGIRTPWTLASPEVWRRTHRLAGWLFVGCGLIVIASGLIHPSVVVLLGASAVVVIVPIAFSYYIYRRLAPDASNDHSDDDPIDV